MEYKLTELIGDVSRDIGKYAGVPCGFTEMALTYVKNDFPNIYAEIKTASPKLGIEDKIPFLVFLTNKVGAYGFQFTKLPEGTILETIKSVFLSKEYLSKVKLEHIYFYDYNTKKDSIICSPNIGWPEIKNIIKNKFL